MPFLHGKGIQHYQGTSEFSSAYECSDHCVPKKSSSQLHSSRRKENLPSDSITAEEVLCSWLRDGRNTRIGHDSKAWKIILYLLISAVITFNVSKALMQNALILILSAPNFWSTTNKLSKSFICQTLGSYSHHDPKPIRVKCEKLRDSYEQCDLLQTKLLLHVILSNILPLAFYTPPVTCFSLTKAVL